MIGIELSCSPKLFDFRVINNKKRLHSNMAMNTGGSKGLKSKMFTDLCGIAYSQWEHAKYATITLESSLVAVAVLELQCWYH